MTVKYLTDQDGNATDVQLSISDYFTLLDKANELPEHVKAGIERGKQQSAKGLTKSTDEVMLNTKRMYEPGSKVDR